MRDGADDLPIDVGLQFETGSLLMSLMDSKDRSNNHSGITCTVNYPRDEVVVTRAKG